MKIWRKLVVLIDIANIIVDGLRKELVIGNPRNTYYDQPPLF
jgi:hypothetical protein